MPIDVQTRVVEPAAARADIAHLAGRRHGAVHQQLSPKIQPESDVVAVLQPHPDASPGPQR